MSEYEAGLHKKISVIFDGVPIPRDDRPERTASDAVPQRSDNVSTKLADALPASASPTPKYQRPAQPPLRDVSLKQPDTRSPQQTETASHRQSKTDSNSKVPENNLWQRIWGQVQSRLPAPKQGVSAAKQKVMVILIPVLFIILVFAFINAFSAPSQKAARPDVAAAPDKTAIAASKNKINWKIPQPYPANIRDPMKLGSIIAGTGEGQLLIKGIVYSQDSPSAVIGTQIVHQGDKISDITVSKINRDSVEFETNGKKWIQKVQR